MGAIGHPLGGGWTGFGLRIPEAKFGFTAGFEAGDFLGAGVVPGEQLPGGCIGVAGVEVTEERG